MDTDLAEFNRISSVLEFENKYKRKQRKPMNHIDKMSDFIPTMKPLD